MDHKTPGDALLLFILVILFIVILFIFFCRLCQEPNNIGPRYVQETRPPRYIQETRPRYVSTGSTCSLEKAAEMAFTTEGTLLHINTGHIYWSEPYEHAEKVFIRQTSASNIHSIWIKNSPCADCSSCLIHHFSMRRTKPTIYIGKIWEGDNGNNRQGLRNLRMKGFTLQVWDTPRNRNIQQTRNYLADL